VSIQWSGLGPDLLVRLDRQGREPLRVQLEDELRDAIRAGRLAAGERLPSSRMLARELGVSRGLVQECYAQLQAEGYITGHTGSATRVASAAREAPPSATLTAAPAQRFAIDFRPGIPDLGSFPRSDWGWALRDALRSASNDAFDYPEPHGSRRLRDVLAAYLRRVRGAAADPERIVICSGFAQGINLVMRALASHGVREMAFEDPGHAGRREDAAAAQLKPIAVAVDGGGIRVDALASTQARAVLLTPAHQHPTGVLLAPERRHALVRWAAERGATLIEDDYDAEFRYDREPVGAIQGLAPEHVIGLGTISKSLAPALRLGWIVCPPALEDAVVREKKHDDDGSPMIEQLALARLIESGRFDRHLRRMRAQYAERRDVLVGALKRHAPQVELGGLAAGFHAVAHLPDHVEEKELIQAAAERSLGLHPMSRHRMDGAASPPQLVLGFGNLSAAQIERGIAILGELLAR
jgi:GntR family transcriptional regulator / MocR family aminotransferase